jgi:hypothetical protein
VDDGILSVKLTPQWDSPSIRSSLQVSLSKSALLQAAVAFWTVSDKLLGCRISPALRHQSGFLCVDLHLPTDIDALASLAQSGAHISLFCEEIATYTENERKEPPCLLHPKMLLFWSTNNTAELWVGSHNWTNRAILGLNIEASVVIKMKDSSPLFCEAAEYLQKIRGICEEFDPTRVEYYKELQKSSDERTVPTIEVEASGAHNLGGTQITIFGDDLRDMKELGTFRKEVFLSATENSANESEYIYPAEITQLGELNSANSAAGEISFSPRRHAVRLGRRLAVLLPYQEVAESSVKSSKYFVTLDLQERDNSISLGYPKARSGVWETSEPEASPLIRRLESSDRMELFRDRKLRLKLPTQIESQGTQELTLYERRGLQERNFLTKRVIRTNR